MSGQSRNINRGRYNEPLSTTNLLENEIDFPEFQPFEDDGRDQEEDMGGATPRGHAPGGGVSVVDVDMCSQINKPNHHTTDYDTGNLVVRRGAEFVIRVTLSGQLLIDDLQLEFLIGSNPDPTKGSMVTVCFGSGHAGLWTGRVVENQGDSLVLGVTPSPKAIVGKFRTYVAIKTTSGFQRTRRDPDTDLYLLFNAWCPEDHVFVADESQRREYVLNDIGVIFQGSVGSLVHRNWMYGQFERGILDACIYILDASRMPITDRGNVVKLIRKGSAMINSQDDNGVLVGNWSEDFSMGTPPTAWTGSAKILTKYASTGVPICFAQCWVFAGVFNTFLRCLGVPARVVTNFVSAHDNTGNLKTDLIFSPDGTLDERRSRDSIWNYHCWNEVCIIRPDLPPELSGWQVVDATPQETSDGHYRCGPASVNAIKEGALCHPFDSGFVFAEVNSDVLFYKRDKYGNLEKFRVDTSYIGQAICTKAVGAMSPVDIIRNYKYPEGSAEDKRTMSRAENLGCEMDHTVVTDPQMSIAIYADQVYLGQDVSMLVDFQNQAGVSRTVQAHLAGAVVFYTGVLSEHFKDQAFSVTVPAYQTERILLKVPAQEYLAHLRNQLCLHFVVTGQSDGQSLSAMKMVQLQTHPLTLQLSGVPQVGHEMVVTVSFTNTYSFTLFNVWLVIEGSGLVEQKAQHYSSIVPQGSITYKHTFHPRRHGQRAVIAAMVCSNVNQMSGIANVNIAE